MEPWLIIAVIITIVAAAFLYEFGRQFYYWSAAKILGWTEHEKFMRETAWIDRAVERDQRMAKRDAAATVNTDRRRFGVYIATAAICTLMLRLNVPWWEGILIGSGVYAGLTMAAGLAWKWW
jgi:hypothetical protein